jgi:hypothetical protein
MGGSSATALGSGSLAVGVVIRGAPGNTGNVYVGDSTVTASTGYLLGPGESVTVVVADLGDAYVYNPSATLNQVVYFVGS